MKFSELQKMLNEAQKLNACIRKEERALPGHFNILEAGNHARDENLYSNLIAFLLDSSEGHKMPAFGKHFLDMLRRKMPALKGERIEYVQREAILNNGRKVDIVIRTNSDEIIILENKVDAADQPNQLRDYYEGMREQNPRKKIFVTYLTRFGDAPSEDSMSIDLVERLTQEHRFSCISYRKEILAWVKKCIAGTKPKPDADNLLRTGLLQLQDAIKGLCDMQEADIQKEKMVLKEFLAKYSTLTKSGKRDELFKLIDAKNTITQGIDALTIIQLFSDIHGHLKERGVGNIRYTYSQERSTQNKKDEWIEEIIKCSECVGMEIKLGNDMGIGIEFSTLDSKAEITFGFMTHGDNKKCPFSKSMRKAISELIRERDFLGSLRKDEKGTYWWEYVLFKPNQSSWLHKEIFGQGENKPEWIAEYIAENWFCPLLELYKQYL